MRTCVLALGLLFASAPAAFACDEARLDQLEKRGYDKAQTVELCKMLGPLATPAPVAPTAPRPATAAAPAAPPARRAKRLKLADLEGTWAVTLDYSRPVNTPSVTLALKIERGQVSLGSFDAKSSGITWGKSGAPIAERNSISTNHAISGPLGVRIAIVIHKATDPSASATLARGERIASVVLLTIDDRTKSPGVYAGGFIESALLAANKFYFDRRHHDDEIRVELHGEATIERAPVEKLIALLRDAQ